MTEQQKNETKIEEKIHLFLERSDNLPLRDFNDPRCYEDSFNNIEFIKSLFLEIGNIDLKTEITYDRYNYWEYLKPFPIVLYSIFKANKEYIKGLPNTFWKHNDPTKNIRPRGYESIVLEKPMINNLLHQYSKRESYTGLKEIKQDLQKDIEDINKRLYISTICEILPKNGTNNEKSKHDRVRVIKRLLKWLIGATPNGRYMYDIDEEFFQKIPRAGDYISQSRCESLNEQRNGGIKINLHTKLIEYILNRKKYGRELGNANDFLKYQYALTKMVDFKSNSSDVTLSTDQLKIISANQDFFKYIETQISARKNDPSFNKDILKDIYTDLCDKWDEIGIPYLYSSYKSFKNTCYRKGIKVNN